MVKLFVNINNKSKTDDRFLFCVMVQLTKSCSPLVSCAKIKHNRIQKYFMFKGTFIILQHVYIYIYKYCLIWKKKTRVFFRFIY